MRINYIGISLIACAMVVWMACGKDEPVVTQDTTPYILEIGHFPPPLLPQDNLPTEAGVKLGRMLFYEKALSKDGSIACADCHQQKDMFADIRLFSIGVDQLPGRRQAMPVFNLAWHIRGFFWDGRVTTLREQALHPIQDPLEMNESLENVVARLDEQKIYQDQFTRAFGTPDVTADRIGLAIEQFELTIVSVDSKYDRFLAGHEQLSPAEERGRVLFFQNADPLNGI
ncbi:MAG: cytochrome-c peroxidase [Bacteroidota bacterium]|nr:cytochrome-c peroxidase [Bacteroidota bacterium]